MNRRVLPLEGLFNVRDLGGYRGDQGRRVKGGLLYRAGDLAGMTGADRAALEARGIRTIVDFRNAAERAHDPDREIGTVERTLLLPIDAGSTLDLSRLRADDGGSSLMELLYRHLVREARPQYTRFFALLSEEGSAPLLFHCSAGKDRTGAGAALILAALGVRRRDIYRDYLLSARLLGTKYEALVAASPHIRNFMTVQRSYLAAAFEVLDAEFGGPRKFVRDELGADLDLLRRLYLE